MPDIMERFYWVIGLGSWFAGIALNMPVYIDRPPTWLNLIVSLFVILVWVICLIKVPLLGGLQASGGLLWGIGFVTGALSLLCYWMNWPMGIANSLGLFFLTPIYGIRFLIQSPVPCFIVLTLLCLGLCVWSRKNARKTFRP